jgi:Lysozyme like domain
MAVLTRQQVYDLARQVGLSQFDAATAGAICDAESGRNTAAVGENRNVSGNVISRDRGLWQINDFYHSDVSDACAFDATCNARAMARISSTGTNWAPWSTFNSGVYRGFLPLYLQIAGFAIYVPPPAVDVVGQLRSKIQRGYPLWAAIFESFESVIGGTLGSELFR